MKKREKKKSKHRIGRFKINHFKTTNYKLKSGEIDIDDITIEEEVMERKGNNKGQMNVLEICTSHSTKSSPTLIFENNYSKVEIQK